MRCLSVKRYKFFEKEISGPFTIPSGIVSTEISILKKIANEIPQVGILTTKSTGVEPRKGNREPIIAQYAPFSFINAVGLTNPGAKVLAGKLSKMAIPINRFLLVSILGSNEREFRQAARILYDCADGFELNISCPHSKRYGQTIGQDKELVKRITESVVSLGKPVLVKISPNLDVSETVKYAIRGGASGITAINTKGPELYLYDGHPILSNRMGGISGKAILELGLKCVKQVRSITSLPIIACGGISKAEHIRDYGKAGANFFGIGSALAGMNTGEIKEYFRDLLRDVTGKTNNATRFLSKKPNMDYRKFIITEKRYLAEDLFLLGLDGDIKLQPGQFIFAWLPEKGEKPFSVFSKKPLKLLIQKRGYFTNELSKLKTNDIVYVRGPYGNFPKIRGRILLTGGGTGIAALYLFARKNKNTVAILGAKDKNHLPEPEKFKTLCQKVYFTTENGEIGHKGLLTDILEDVMQEIRPEYCINCGPEAMVKAAIQKEKKYVNPEKIYSSIDFLTRCGIGLCGSCTTSQGYRSCVDGTFLKPEQI